MDGKSGGAIVVGTATVAITCLTAVFRGESSPPKKPAANHAIQSFANLGERDGKSSQKSHYPVTVFYATDRAVANSLSVAHPRDVRTAGLIAGLGLLAFSAWFQWRGQKKVALTTGTLGVAASIVWIVSSPWFVEKRGIGRSYLSSYRYGSERGELELGYCVVSVPHSHRAGELESPSILRLELKARADRHVMLQHVVRQQNTDFYRAIHKRVAMSPQRDLFVFVHGYNVNFESAARRTAQIAFDLRYEGAPIFFSWPSQGKTWGYTVDETNVTWSVPHLKQFLTELARRSDAQAINLIAHSMGNRALTQAIYELGYECKQETKLFQQVILAAPDIDADVFREQIAPHLTRVSSQITLYASSSDEALAASKLVHGSRRAGESFHQPITIPGIETVDVAATELGPLGHSYYGSCPLILQDLAAILHEGRPAANRPWLAPIRGRGPLYWRLEEEASVAASPSTTLRKVE